MTARGSTDIRRMRLAGAHIALAIALITLYLYDARAMLAVSLMRVLFVSLLQGTLFATSFWLSLSGVLLSCAAMSIARRCRCCARSACSAAC